MKTGNKKTSKLKTLRNHYRTKFLNLCRYRTIVSLMKNIHSWIHVPRFKLGDLVSFDLNQITVIYEVKSFGRSSCQKGKIYTLEGKEVLNSDYRNFHLGATIQYFPLCVEFDKTARRVKSSETRGSTIVGNCDHRRIFELTSKSIL